MSYKSTALIARKSIRARIGRLIGISIAIVVGVSFVVGSFVLADSLRNTFDNLFTQITENVDLQVRSAVAFESDAGEIDQRDPIPASLADAGGGRRRRRRHRAAAAAVRPARRQGGRGDHHRRARRRLAWRGPATPRSPGWRSRARACHRSVPTRSPSTRRRPIARTSSSVTRSPCSPTPGRTSSRSRRWSASGTPTDSPARRSPPGTSPRRPRCSVPATHSTAWTSRWPRASTSPPCSHGSRRSCRPAPRSSHATCWSRRTRPTSTSSSTPSRPAS